MSMLKAGLCVAAIVFGSVAALLGFTLIVAALRGDAITYSMNIGDTGAVVREISRDADGATYWLYITVLGVLPLLLGGLLARWGYKKVRG